MTASRIDCAAGVARPRIAPVLCTLLGLASAPVPASALEAPAGVRLGPTDQGLALITARGRTLYTFDNDAAGVPACYGACAERWPPLSARAGERALGRFSIVARRDDGLQWAYEGRPLYRHFADLRNGEAAGHHFRALWHVARP